MLLCRLVTRASLAHLALLSSLDEAESLHYLNPATCLMIADGGQKAKPDTYPVGREGARPTARNVGSSSGFGGDELDLNHPFRFGQRLDDNARRSGPCITPEFGACLRHRPEVLLARHIGHDLDDIIDPHTG